MARNDSSFLKTVLGPTNTGKTHLAVERLCAHSSGIIGFPLRLLAREVYDRVVAIKGAAQVGLLTGEEKIMPPGARWILATVESMPQNRDVAFIAIDEAQLCADPERGHIFTDRLLHARGREETMILGSDSLRPIARTLLPEAEITGRPRFSSLEHAGTKKLSRLPQRSAVIGFSTEEVYAAAEFIRRSRGGAAIVMGSLSPKTRNAQVAMYQAGEVDFLVATDAVGMGLNMDLGHVAFAGLTKFDGRRRRRLSVPEMAQIAGRAGRHHRNGTFGTVTGLGQTPEFTPEEIDRIEEHRFLPLDHIRWRNSDLDMSSPARLLDGLALPSPSPLLRQASDALDENILRIVTAAPEMAGRRWTPFLTDRLWQACRLPDFLKRGAEFHAGLVSRLWEHLGGGNGTIPASWIASELARLDSIQGDIDTVSGRIAAIRTWAYIAHQSDWLDDPADWSGRTMELEHKLSDALHKKLTERFVDRRTSLLLRSKSPTWQSTAVHIDEAGTVSVEGEIIGSLDGFLFKPARDATHKETKALISAAEKQLVAHLSAQALEMSAASDKALSLVVEAGNPPAICWKGKIVATLVKGRTILDPNVKLASGPARLPAADRRMMEIRLQHWVKSQINSQLGRMRWIAKAAQSKEHGGNIRAVLAAMLEGLGHTDRHTVWETLATTSAKDRSWLKQAGVVIGSLDVFIAQLLDPRHVHLRVSLACAYRGQSCPPLPKPGMGLLDKPGPGLAEGARLAGFRALGDQMVRIDLLEQVAQEVHRSRTGKDDFQPSARTAERIGIGEETFRRVMRALGFRPAAASTDNNWRWHGLKPPVVRRGRINPAFAQLARIARR